MGRKFDWDLEKYRISEKPADKGNRRRVMKNLSRFVKNPIGYTYWKMKGTLKNRNLYVMFLVGVGLFGFYDLYE